MSGININSVQIPQLKEFGMIKEKNLDTKEKFSLLSKIDESELQEKLTKMVEGIRDQGNKISKHMDIRDVRLYRELIAEFVNEVTTNSHKFYRDNILDKKGKHRVYSIIRTINYDVDEIARELLKSEKNNIALLEKIGEVNGLILDILT